MNAYPGQPQQPWSQPAPPSYVLSGWWRRAGALIIDGIVVNVVASIIGAVIGVSTFASGSDFEGESSGLDIAFIFIGLAISAIYYCWLMQSTNGQTLGKMATGIRVVREDGEAMDAAFAFKRQILVIGIIFNFFGILLLGIPFLLNYLWPLWDDGNQALHDKMVNSRVVMAQSAVQAPPMMPAAGYPTAPQAPGYPTAPPAPYGAPQPYAPPAPGAVPPDPFAPPVPPVPPAPQPPAQAPQPPAPPMPQPPPPPPPAQASVPPQPVAPQAPPQPPPAVPPAPQPPVQQPPQPPAPPVPPPPPAPQPPAPQQPPGQTQPYQPPPGFENPVPEDDK